MQVISVNVIEHVQNAFDYLASLHAACKPGGILLSPGPTMGLAVGA